MKILIAEDDGILRSGLAELLEGAGYEPVCADSLSAARSKAANSGPFSLYLVDVMLGDGSGLTFVREIRRSESTPIIILTVLDGEDSVVEGLSCGADDYVTKPFRSGELLARIAANIRRQNAVNEVIISGDVELWLNEGRLTVRGEEKTLRRSELALLELFMRNGGKLLKRERIFDSLWSLDADSVEENTLSVLVSRLRRELGKYNSRDYIETVRGIGYRWCVPCENGSRL